MSDLAAIKRALQRERNARKEAESIMEAKSLELYESNQQLQNLNASLEKEVAMRTEEIKKSALQLSIMFEDHPIPMMVYGLRDFKFIAVNQTAINNYGYSGDEFLTMNIADLYAKDDITEIEAHMDTVRSGFSEIQDWKHKTKNGKLMDVEISAKAIEYYEERAWLVLIKDVTERKIAEQEQAASERKYKELVETVSDLIYRCDMNGHFTYVNPICEHKIGYSQSEFLASNFNDLIRDDYKKKVKKFYFKQLTSKQQSSYLEFPVVAKDGKEIWLGQTVEISHTNDGQNNFEVIALARDITDRIRAQEAMQRSEEKYRGIIENLQLGLLEVDTRDVITKAYPKFCELTGYSSNDLIGQNASNFLLPGKYQSFLQMQNVDLMHGNQSVYEVELIRKDNSKVWVLVSGAPFHDHDGNVVGYIGIHLDITEQKNIEKELVIAKDTAEDSVRSKELFMANMSHEIRTPMNAIIGMGELLRKSTLTSKQKEFLEAIETSAENLLIIINDILDFSKIEAGKMELSYLPVDLIKLLEDALTTIELKAESKGVTINTNFHQNIDIYEVDPTRLRQVVINLLSNAVKFTDAGSIDLQCTIVEPQGDHDKIRFSVKDSGIGIAVDKLENVFESFIQADENTAHQYGGTGLGLSISKQLVQLMGSELKIESELGKGSEFYFELSCKKLAAFEEKTPEEKQNFAEKLAYIKVLLVEDHEINRFMAQTILENWKCEVLVATNGLEAVQQVTESDIDIILMDMRMPEMDGLQATAHIRQELNSTIPIIGLTANAIKGDKEKCIEVGMNDYVSKPFKQEDLMNKMIKHLSNEQSLIRKADHNKQKSMEMENIVDLTRLISSTNGDRGFMNKMIKLFLEDTPKQIAEINEAERLLDWDTVSRVAHRMKPSIDHLANSKLQKLVRQVEGVEKSDNSIEDLSNQFKLAVDQLIIGLQKEI